MDRPQNCYRERSPSTDCRPQNSAPPPTKFVSFQPQAIEQPLQQPPRTEMLLEQLIQRYDCDYEEQKSRQCPEETLPPNRQQSPRHQSQNREPYANRFDQSASQVRPRTTQPTGLWCEAHKSCTHNTEHKSCTHNTEDCVWLKGQNAQQLTRQEPNRPIYAAHSQQTDFRTNSNDILYDGKAQFVIQTDASTTAIGAILYQENRNDQWVIAYNSCVLTDAET
uniref:Reverse transcriptase/retrotransposon-derived protein RNase H-like domain-containing protein n=1 Tax=Romanomermis culicivorax TaxID=13658 RepID=A0A915ICM8_ROMCU